MNNNVKLFKKCKHLDKLEIKLKSIIQLKTQNQAYN